MKRPLVSGGLLPVEDAAQPLDRNGNRSEIARDIDGRGAVPVMSMASAANILLTTGGASSAMQPRAARPSDGSLHNKVPQVTLAFWAMKICATTLGETGGDLLSMTMNVGYAASTLILFGIFVVALASQLRAKAFHPFLYWAVILATSTAGTTMSDYMDRTLGLGYVAGSAILIAALVAVLGVWRASAGSLSVDNIRTLKVEAFYWAAILVSNTLGTAFGDFLADSSGFGFGGGALLISGAITLIALAYFYTKVSRTLLFWMAFVLTRPLGATAGDLLTKTHEKGGLGLGTIGTSLILAALLASLILYTSRRAPH